MPATTQALELLSLNRKLGLQDTNQLRVLRQALRIAYDEGRRDEATVEKLAQAVTRSPRSAAVQVMQDYMDECEKKYRSPQEIEDAE